MRRVYERERKKIKAKAIDSNTTALDEGRAEEEVTTLFVASTPYVGCMSATPSTAESSAHSLRLDTR